MSVFIVFFMFLYAVLANMLLSGFITLPLSNWTPCSLLFPTSPLFYLLETLYPQQTPSLPSFNPRGTVARSISASIPFVLSWVLKVRRGVHYSVYVVEC